MKHILPLLFLIAGCLPHESWAGDIIVGPDSSQPGIPFFVTVPSNLVDSLKVEPKPKLMQPTAVLGGFTTFVVQQPESPGYTFSVDQWIEHPSLAELAEFRKIAPDDAAKINEWHTRYAKDEILKDTLVVKVGNQPKPDPKPDPNPDPDPDPKPDPVEGPFWIIVLEESADRDAETALIKSNTKFWDSLKSDGHQYRWYDDDSEDAEHYINVEGVTKDRPALIIQDLKGNILRSTNLPKTIDGIKTIIDEVSK